VKYENSFSATPSSVSNEKSQANVVVEEGTQSRQEEMEGEEEEEEEEEERRRKKNASLHTRHVQLQALVEKRILNLDYIRKVHEGEVTGGLGL
jgi:hypothetical protein